MAKINEIPENIGDFMKYDETSSTGLRWIKLISTMCRRVTVGDEAGYLNQSGYYYTQFNGKRYKNHRVIFFLHHGYCPDCVDHIDNISTNNKIDNLREATISQNNKNRKLNKNNSSGVKGLSKLTDKKTGIEYLVCRIKGFQSKIFRKDIPNSRQLAEQWLLDNRKEHHGEFANNG